MLGGSRKRSQDQKLSSKIFIATYPSYLWAKALWSSLTLSDPKEGSPPGSSVHGILQARILGWIAMPFSRGSSQCRDQTHSSYVSCIDRSVLYH